MGQPYRFKNILALLTEGFSASELKTMCFDQPALRPIYEELSDQANKTDLARKIIDYATQRLAIESILNWAKETNLSRYEMHQPYLADEVSKTDPLAQFVPDNDLGYGIALGGVYQNTPLEVAATQWAEYGSGWVRSGWLFVPQLSESHSVAFFKVHVLGDGKGYIHIADVADPIHSIWLATRAGFRREQEFHYAAHPSDIWDFTWK